MSTDKTPTTRRAVDRRTVTTGLAWSVPAVAATAAAPFAAASLVKNPGINGWVLTSASGRGCQYDVTVTSRPANPGRTPDGAPYGLYLYDTDPRGHYDAAKLVYWVRGDHTRTNRISWRAGRNHSSCWTGRPTVGAAQTKSDGAVYTPYTWEYRCEISPEDVSDDGRLYLRDFEVSATINQSFRGRCEPLQFWAYREIRVDADGDGPLEPELMHFERHADLNQNRGYRSTDGATADEAGTDVAAAEDLSASATH